jgi:hypothetical protein
MSSVKAWSEPVELPTYEPAEPDRNPMFLEKRVYQGSSGRVYPLPYYDRIAERPTPRRWSAIHLENEYLYVMILPELGGRIHIGRDKTNGYDFFYNQRVIKPALVGLAGPWCSGGVEFNWPQHHRPATFMPVETEIEAHPDGSVTVWCSDHDPMLRMKGMHGVCLHPGRAVIELKVRAYNRTDQPQSFLWWANVATKVHDQYQSFFPPDVTYVADHARRSMSEYPLCQGRYYGVDYGKRSGFSVQDSVSEPERRTLNTEPPVPNDLSWYRNIPVPTSYMCMGSQEDFFGGYDHAARAGVVHVANHHISPGKKQWTWGNHPFGYAWDRNLTDPDAKGTCAPYIEIMAGVYTDNQPDFSFLMPGETKAWSQFWYPIREIGPAQQATADAALALRVAQGVVHLGLAVTCARTVRVELAAGGRVFHRQTVKLDPAAPLVTQVRVPPKFQRLELSAAAFSNGRTLIKYVARAVPRGAVPPPATEPPPPASWPAPTSFTSRGCIWSSTATRRAVRRCTGARPCGAMRGIRGAISPSDAGTCGVANWPRRSSTCASPSRASRNGMPIPTTGRRTTRWGCACVTPDDPTRRTPPSTNPRGTSPGRRRRITRWRNSIAGEARGSPRWTISSVRCD